ncbi:MAG: IPT/TIG domain-containing protein [Sphingobacteriaceae bacterium]|nr:IPT/TIG domain-containing protein [Cytophagaceae bacterium]
MRFLQNWKFSVVLTTLLFAVVVACKNDDTPEPVVTITSVNPTSAPVGSDLTITGTQFSTTPADNKVTFTGGVVGTVKSATATQLVVTVPTGAQNGAITVQVGSKPAVTSTATFTLGAKPVQDVMGDLTTSATWNSNTVYLLKGFVYVKDGVTITIQPGTIIKGAAKELDPSGQAKGGTLIVEAGGKLIAEGTADLPIVFTSSKAAGQRNYGDWGGIVLIGKAPHNQLASRTFEGGIRGSFQKLDVANDNSGSLKYVRIEFAGIALTAGSEVNGLSLYGVGSGTTIDYVQVSYSGDDSFEWFGGTVNAKHLVAYRTFDDDFDTDFGFTGKVQYALALRDPAFADQSGSNGFESDNQAGDGTNAGVVPTPVTAPVFANVSVFGTSGTPSTATNSGSGGYQSALHLRRASSISIFNSVFVGFPEGLRLDYSTTLPNTVGSPSAMQLRNVTIANVLTDIKGGNTLTDAQAQAFFNTAAFGNSIVTSANLGTLGLNANAFKLDGTAAFTPAAGSSLLTGATWLDKGSDAFFTKEPFKGAFGTTNWTEKWANFNPQQTDYDK